MTITKTKEQIYEWFTTKNWFKSYEKNLFSYPKSRVRASTCTNFKDYLDYAFKKLIEEGDESYVEYLSLDFMRDSTNQGWEYWQKIDESYWANWMCKD